MVKSRSIYWRLAERALSAAREKERGNVCHAFVHYGYAPAQVFHELAYRAGIEATAEDDDIYRGLDEFDEYFRHDARVAY